MTFQSFSEFFLKSILQAWPAFLVPDTSKLICTWAKGRCGTDLSLQALTVPSECFWFPNCTFNQHVHVLYFWSLVQILSIHRSNWISEEPHWHSVMWKFLYTINLFHHHCLILISLINEIHFIQYLIPNASPYKWNFWQKPHCIISVLCDAEWLI